MSRKHTPGPWQFGGSLISSSDGKNEIARVLYRCQDRHKPNDHSERAPEYEISDSNRQLIAAAPDLLAALDYLLEQTVDMDLKYGVELTEGETDARRQALEAIEKAVGE